MKRTLLISAVVVAVSAVALSVIAPKYIAPEHQKQVVQFVEKINDVPGYSARINTTELSGFGSDNNITLDIDLTTFNPSFNGQTVKIDLDVETRYGPFLFSSDGLFGWFKSDVKIAADELREYLVWDESEAFYQISFVGGLTNSVHYFDQIVSFTNMDEKLKVAAYRGEGDVVDNQTNYKGHFGKVEWATPKGAFEVENVGVELIADTNIEKLLVGGFYNSVTEFTIESLKAGDSFSTEGLALIFESISRGEEQLSDVKMKYLIDDISVNDITAKNFVLETELINISQSFLLKIQESQKDLAGVEGNQQEQALALISDYLEELLSKSPEFNITDLSLSIFDGEIKANLSSRFADIESPQLQDFLDKDALLYNLLAEARVKVDDVVLSAIVEKFLALQTRGSMDADALKQQAQIMISQFESQGFIIKEGEHYYTELSLKDSEGKVNEFAFPL